MNYQETLDYLYNSLPMFQKIGGAAYNKGLDKTLKLLEILDNPHRSFKTIHIAGTNGKGSTSSMLAAVLQSAGYKTGLYTSPHLKNFSERIRINGIEIPEPTIVSFVQKHKDIIEEIKPSFFELTVAMAFDYYAKQKVDIAVIEVGMGGRLDSTNVIDPLVSIITNISYDHQAFLGNTLQEIANEKAGIIKDFVPVVISEKQPETEQVFRDTASKNNAPIYFASDLVKIAPSPDQNIITISSDTFTYYLSPQLKGIYQRKNLGGVITAIEILKKSFTISEKQIIEGLENACTLSGLKGRWQVLNEKPITICDTGHNEAGISFIIEQLKTYSYKQLHWVIGMVSDKDYSKILKLLPKEALYYFCQPNIPRALDAGILANRAANFGLKGKVIPSVNDAYIAAKQQAKSEDLIFIGGSTFVVGELIQL